MPASRVSFHPAAQREAEEAQDWYLGKSPSAEEGFLSDLAHAVNQIAGAPLRWPRHKADTRRYVFRRYPYSLIYRIYGDLIRVLAVAQDSRREDYWVDRR